MAFAGLVESSVRKFAERAPRDVLAVPCCRVFSRAPDAEAPTHRTVWFLGLKIPGRWRSAVAVGGRVGERVGGRVGGLLGGSFVGLLGGRVRREMVVGRWPGQRLVLFSCGRLWSWGWQRQI